MITELAGRTAVITGAGSGIGRALVLRCHEQGMRVVAAEVEETALQETVGLADGDVLAVRCDVASAADVQALADAAFEAYGEVHLLCNNAGVFQAGVVWERTLDDWEWVLGVNLGGIVHAIRSFLPRMITQGGEGHVVNTSSLAGLGSNPFCAPYTTSKFAALALTESLAHDLAATGAGIGASVLVPGSVATRISSSQRNRPENQADGIGAADHAFVEAALAEMNSTGLDPAAVADLVLDAVRTGQFVIPTSPGYDDQVRRRAAVLLDRGLPQALPFD